MVLLVENTVDAAKEKHVPVIEKTDAGVKVKIGAVAHPMEEKHYMVIPYQNENPSGCFPDFAT
jgi:superoxide reductase